MRGARRKSVKQQVDEQVKDETNAADLSISDRECCIHNFKFYVNKSQGYADLFELPMVLSACGYNLPDARIEEL